MAKEVIVALLRFAVFKLPPSTTTNMNKMAESPVSQEPSEMQISFMMSSKGYFCVQTEKGWHETPRQ
jgi:hypothetical protein